MWLVMCFMIILGEMLCTIHQSVMDEHCHELQPGAVLILRQVL